MLPGPLSPLRAFPGLPALLALVPLLVAGPPQAWESGQLPTPALTRGEVRADTVWFFESGRGGRLPSDTVAYGRDLEDGGWVRRHRWRAGPNPRRLPASASDTVPVGRGLSLVRQDGDGRGRAGGGALYAVHSRPDGRTVPLDAEIPDDVKPEIFPRDRFHPTPSREKMAEESAAGPSAWALGEDALWVGLGGGYSEGYGALGGLLRYDLETDRVEGIWEPELGAVTVSDMVVADGRVWMGTLSPGEYGPYGTQGLLAYDPGSGRLEQFTAGNSPLPSDLVWTVEAAGGRVWAATRKGVAGVEPATREWTVARFRPELEGDALVFDLVEGAAPDSTRIGVFLLMQAVGTERRAAFLETARSLPPDRFRAYAREPHEPAAALAHPDFVPFLVEALGEYGRGRVAARALKEIPRPERREEIARALEEAPPDRASLMASHLVGVELPQGRAWIRDHLDPARAEEDEVAAAVEAAAQVRDSGIVEALLDLVAADGPHALAAVETLIKIGPAEGWETIHAWLRRHPEHRSTFLERSREYSMWNVWEQRAYLDVLCSVAHGALDSRDRDVARRAAGVLARLEDPAGMRALVERFMERSYELVSSQSTLEYVTGVESPVRPRRGDDDAVAETRSFWRMWLEQGGAEAYASCREGRNGGG